jgi:hypothetical protein
VAVFEDFQQITAFRRGQDGKPPIIQDQHLNPGGCCHLNFASAEASNF